MPLPTLDGRPTTSNQPSRTCSAASGRVVPGQAKTSHSNGHPSDSTRIASDDEHQRVLPGICQNDRIAFAEAIQTASDVGPSEKPPWKRKVSKDVRALGNVKYDMTSCVSVYCLCTTSIHLPSPMPVSHTTPAPLQSRCTGAVLAVTAQDRHIPRRFLQQ